MISIKKYLDASGRGGGGPDEPEDTGILGTALEAYGSAMITMGQCSLDACPGIGDGLEKRLIELQMGLSPDISAQAIKTTDHAVQESLSDWGQQAARHYRQKAAEVKDLLLVIARTAESVGTRDQRCAGQMNEVTARLKRIATLEDLTEIRSSIEKSAAELKSSIDKMAEEGKAAVEDLKKQVTVYQARLEEAEELASRDSLTGVRNRMCVESMIENRIAGSVPFCVAMVDIDGFKKVNDTHGHLAGDDLLKQFATELRSACRSTDVIGRWGGDEFIILLDCQLEEATQRVYRLRKWVCGDYTVRGPHSAIKLSLEASIGLAGHRAQESVEALMARADAAMYERKGAGRETSPAVKG